MADFGELFREARRSRSISMLAIATELEVSENFLYDVERGRRQLRAEHVEKLIVFLGITRAAGDAMRVEAMRERGRSCLPALGDDRDKLAAELARVWARLPAEKLERVREVIAA